MKAVEYKKSLPIDAADALIDFEATKPEPTGRDIRVAVKAVSVNPADYNVRKRAEPPEGQIKILGYDAAGIVDAVGPEVTVFKPGDEVFYAGSIQRQGTNSELHLVDERIVGKKPKALSFAQAAALPLTTITAWELLFDRLGAVPGKSLDPRTLLITGGAGGVGSILIQLARRLTGPTVVATATRPESQKWCLDLGAHSVIDHGRPMKEQIEKLKLSQWEGHRRLRSQSKKLTCPAGGYSLATEGSGIETLRWLMGPDRAPPITQQVDVRPVKVKICKPVRRPLKEAHECIAAISRI